jgi:hypothetical protein
LVFILVIPKKKNQNHKERWKNLYKERIGFSEQAIFKEKRTRKSQGYLFDKTRLIFDNMKA